MFECKCRLFSMSSSSFFCLNECNCCTSSIVYFHNIVLPFLMSVNCVDHFVSVTSWSVMCGCLVQVTCLSGKALFNFKKMSSYLHRTIWMWRSQCPCMCGDVLAWFFDGRLFSDQPALLIIACEHKWDVWTITLGGGRGWKKRLVRPGLPHLTLFCEIADTWNVSRQHLQN